MRGNVRLLSIQDLLAICRVLCNFGEDIEEGVQLLHRELRVHICIQLQ